MDLVGPLVAGATAGVVFVLTNWTLETARSTLNRTAQHDLAQRIPTISSGSSHSVVSQRAQHDLAQLIPTISSGASHSVVSQRAQSAPASSDDTECRKNEKKRTLPPPDDAEKKGSSEPPAKRARTRPGSEAGLSDSGRIDTQAGTPGSSSLSDNVSTTGSSTSTSIAPSHDVNAAAAGEGGNSSLVNTDGANAEACLSNLGPNLVYATPVSSPSPSNPSSVSTAAPSRRWSPLSVTGTGQMDIDFLVTPSTPQTHGAPLPDAAAAHHTPEVRPTVSERLYEDFVHLHDRLPTSHRQTSGSPRLCHSRADKGKGKAYYKTSNSLANTPAPPQPEFIQGSSRTRRVTSAHHHRLFPSLPPISTLGLLSPLPRSFYKQSPSPHKHSPKLRRSAYSPTPPPRTASRIFSSPSLWWSREPQPCPAPYMPTSSPSYMPPSPAAAPHSPIGSDAPLPPHLLWQAPFPQRGSPPVPTPPTRLLRPQLTMPELPPPPAPRPAHATIAPPLEHPVPRTLHNGVPGQLADLAQRQAQAEEILSSVYAAWTLRMEYRAPEEPAADERAPSSSSFAPTPPARWNPALEQPPTPLTGDDALGRSAYPDHPFSPGSRTGPLAAPRFFRPASVPAPAPEPAHPPIATIAAGDAPSQPASAAGSDASSLNLMYPSPGSVPARVARKLASTAGSQECESEEEDELADYEEEL